MKRILIIAGTRPEVIKLFPVYKELKRNRFFEVLWVSTGQHREMLLAMYNFFGIKPDVDLSVMIPNQNLATLTSVVLLECSAYFDKVKPDCVVVQGDTTSAMAASMAAFYKSIPVAHVEAGLRSYNFTSPFPEEVNRRIISTFASLNFAPTKASSKVLVKEELPGKIFVTGNTVIDSLLFGKKQVRNLIKSNQYREFDLYLRKYKGMILITGHRRENYYDNGFNSICKGIMKLAEQFPQYSFVYPVHLNPNVQKSVYSILKNIHNIFLIDPVPYDKMIFLMTKCKLVLTDSGGIQEEAPALGKPVLIMRNTTERPEGIHAGCSKLIGTSEQKIFSEAQRLLIDTKAYNAMSKVRNPFGDGKSAKRIALHLKAFLK